MSDVVTMEDFKREQKKRERNAKIKKGISDVITFVDEHKEGVTVVAGLVLGGSKVVKNLSSNRTTKKKLKEERNHRDLEIYDHSTGQYLKLKRPMTAVETLEYTARCRNKEAKAFILHDMGLLRR